MKRKRSQRRRKCIGCKRKHSVGGGSCTRRSQTVPRYVKAVSPALRVRRKLAHRAITPETVVDGSPDLWKDRRMSIFTYWRDVLGCPGPSTWSGRNGVAGVIHRNLSLKKGSNNMVHKVLRAAWSCQQRGVPYVDNSAQVGSRPHHAPLIQPGSVEEQLVADAVEDNVSYKNTVDIVNGHIKAVNPNAEHVTINSVKSCVDRLAPDVCAITRTHQGASYGRETAWAKARYQQFQQHRLRMGRVKLEDLSVEDQANPAFIVGALPEHSYKIEQVAFWDETQPKCRIGGRAKGPQSKTQRRFLRDGEQKLNINGKYNSRQEYLECKFSKDIRLSLGCAIYRDDDGILQGARLTPFNYTGCWVETITTFEEECIPKQIKKIKSLTQKRGWVEGERTPEEGIWEEDLLTVIPGIGPSKAKTLRRMGIRTVRQLARQRSSRLDAICRRKGYTRTRLNEWLLAARNAHPDAYVSHVVDHRKHRNPYQSRYGDEWRIHIAEDIRKSGHVCITELITHINSVTGKFFDGTEFEENYFWYHDALKQLTCKRTKRWLIESGLIKHWLLPIDPCNEGTIYHGRPVGNSQAVMPWDCSLNHDVHAKVDYYSTLFRWVQPDHPLYPKRFSKANPSIMVHSYLRILDPVTGVCPSSERIVQDVTKCWGTHLDIICGEDVRGAGIGGLGSRVGRRVLHGLEKRGGKRKKGKWTKNNDLHEDCVEALAGFVERAKARHKGCR